MCGDVWRRLWEMCGGGCERCVDEAVEVVWTVGDVWKRLWEMCRDVWRRLWEMCGGGCERCVE